MNEAIWSYLIGETGLDWPNRVHKNQKYGLVNWLRCIQEKEFYAMPAYSINKMWNRAFKFICFLN